MLAVEFPVVRAAVRWADAEQDDHADASEAARALQAAKARVPAARARLGKRRWESGVDAAGDPWRASSGAAAAAP